MDAAATHAELYDGIPSFRCRPGCNDCCGPVMMTDYELSRLSEAQQALMAPDAVVARVKAGNLTCPMSTALGCSIYDKRPYLCRVFGAGEAKRLECPHGCGPVKKLGAAALQAKTDVYRRLMGV